MDAKDARSRFEDSGIPDGNVSTERMETTMRMNRKALIGMLAAAGLATAGALAFADPPGGFGGGAGDCGYGAGGAGWAQGGGHGPGMMGYGGGPRGGYGPGMRGFDGGRGGGYGPGAAGAGVTERVDARLAYLKDSLKITPEQESAWDAYATQVKAQAATMAAFHAQGPATGETAAERIEQHASRMKLRAEQAQAMSASVKELFAVLTPEQQTIANQHFGGPRYGQAGGRGYGRGRWN